LVVWEALQASDFERDPLRPDKVECYQAEVLVHQHFPTEALTGVACASGDLVAGLEAQMAAKGLTIKVVAKPAWFFQ
jgi:hypothetical protein